eukprot:2693470-Rhodomonas_salina.1
MPPHAESLTSSRLVSLAGSFAEQPTVLDKSPAPTTTTTPPPATSSSSALRRTCSDLSSQGLLSAAAVLLAISAYATA